MKFSIKRVLILILFIISIGTVFLGARYYKQNSFTIKTADASINTDPSYVRIYYDFATVPSLFQVYDFLNQSPDSTAFILWTRIPRLEKKLSFRKNTHVMYYKKNLRVNCSNLKMYYQKYPNTKFILHTGDRHAYRILSQLYFLPKNAIKEIHLYEDSSYFATFDQDSGTKAEIDFLLNYQLKDYKVFYHIEDACLLNSKKCMLSKKCVENKKKYKNLILVKSSMNDLKKNLNNNKKIEKPFFKIFDFEPEKFRKEMIHPFGIYTFEPRLGTVDEQQLLFMNEFLNGKLKYLIKDKNIKWFYKEHPGMYSMDEEIRKLFPNMIQINRKIPIQLFIFADIIPDHTAGYSSSLFLSFPRDSITMYIKRETGDAYSCIIKRKNLLRSGRTFSLYDTDHPIRFFLKRFVSRVLVLFQ